MFIGKAAKKQFVIARTPGTKGVKDETDETIVILSADKGCATVVMNTSFYQRKIEENLNPYTYKKTEKRSYGSGPKTVSYTHLL